MKTMSVSEVRAGLREALDRVSRGEEVGITRRGELAAVIVPPSKSRAGTDMPSVKAAEELRMLLDDLRSGRRHPSGRAELSATEADAWVRQIRANRDAETD